MNDTAILASNYMYEKLECRVNHSDSTLPVCLDQDRKVRDRLTHEVSDEYELIHIDNWMWDIRETAATTERKPH